MKDYVIHKSFGKVGVKNGDLIRVDLLDGFKIKNIPELKNFNFYYEIKGHVDSAFRKGKKVERKVRYVRLFNKKKNK
ncbi:hypothetical protein [Clostridium perfringens]|uniref:hypothetical protein n=1 Tax=Clostridium perfringens TaxID=1502 RepID=UPI00224852B2|nr:hypothetical protein [Clostridium perfringens]MCX0408340.1 hypothetical protein [Clostridium perfringens]